MQNGKDILTIEEVLASLDFPSKREEVFNQLRSLEPQSEELKGIKDFLESNNYDHHKLAAFVSKSGKNFDAIATKANRQSSRNTWLKVAAVIIPLIGLATFFLLNKPTTDLYAKYYEKEAGLPVFMDVRNDKVFNESMNAYKDTDFQSAVTGFEHLLTDNPNNDTLHYFIGCSKLELHEFNEAIEHFNKVAGQSTFKEKSEYRLILCFIGRGENSEAEKRLNELIKNKNHRYHSRAIKMLEEL